MQHRLLEEFFFWRFRIVARFDFEVSYRLCALFLRAYVYSKDANQTCSLSGTNNRRRNYLKIKEEEKYE